MLCPATTCTQYRLTQDSRFTEQEEAEERHIATCPERLYPNIPKPAIPTAVSLVSHTGHFQHPAYSSIFVTLDCDEYIVSSDVPSRIGEDSGCGLQIRSGPDTQWDLLGNLTHITGNFWLAYAYIREIEDEAYACVRTQFRLDASGNVTAIGVDVRMEEEDTPLVWYERVL